MNRSEIPLLLLAILGAGTTNPAADAKPWLHPKTQALEVSETGPFVLLKEGSLVTVRGGDALLSHDEGKTWERRPISKTEKLNASPEIVTFLTREGTSSSPS